MIEVVLVFVFMLTMVGAMSVGVIFGRQPISGTCGGLNRMGADGACEICGGQPEDCERDQPLPESDTQPDYHDAAGDRRS